MTARQEILEVVRGLTARGLAPFSPQQVIDELRRRGTTYRESTLRTHIVDIMCVDSPTDRTTSYPDLRRVGRGQYVLASGDDAARRSSMDAEDSAASPTATLPSETSRPWHWEGHVQASFCRYLVNQGWALMSVADTAARQRGPDVVAKRGGVELVVEVKGYPTSTKLSASTQARHYMGGALLTVLLAWAERPDVQVGLVLPDVPTFRTLLSRLSSPLDELSIAAWLVSEDGTVRQELPGQSIAVDPDVGKEAPSVREAADGPPPPPSEPVRELALALERDIETLKREIGYDPTRWRQMLGTHGPVEAARRLLRGPDVSDGFTKLWEHGRLDFTVEWQVLAHASLFSDDERTLAYQRLKSYEAPVDKWLVERLDRRWR